MSYIYLPHFKPRHPARRSPWLLFLFIALTLLVVFHWPFTLHTRPDNYNIGDEIAIPGLDSSLPREVMLIALGVASIISLRGRRGGNSLRIHGMMGWFLIGLVSWAVLSVAWAQDLTLTLKRLSSFLIICLFATTAARRLTLRQVLLWTFFTTAFYLGIAFAVEIANGIFHPFTSGYRFSGLQHPNGEGPECALLAFSGFVAGHTESRRKWLYRSGGLFGLIFLLLTASRTTLAGISLTFSLYTLTVVKQRTRSIILGFAAICVSLILFFAVAGTFQETLQKSYPGRDQDGVESFAGRTSVWADLIPYIRERPLQGYGYGGFWTPSILSIIADKEGWDVPDGHSTYIDYVLTLGVVGLILNWLCIASGLGKALRAYYRTSDPLYIFIVGVLLFCVVDGFLESAAGEVSPLLCLTLICLIHLAFVPTSQGATSTADNLAPKNSPTWQALVPSQ